MLGEEHPDTLTSRNNLAVCYFDAGRTSEAIAPIERNIATSERVLGDAIEAGIASFRAAYESGDPQRLMREWVEGRRRE